MTSLRPVLLCLAAVAAFAAIAALAQVVTEPGAPPVATVEVGAP